MVSRTQIIFFLILIMNLLAYFFIIHNNRKSTQKLLEEISKLKQKNSNHLQNIKNQEIKMSSTLKNFKSCNNTLTTVQKELQISETYVSNLESQVHFYSLRYGKLETEDEAAERYKIVTIKYQTLKHPHFVKRKNSALIIDGFPFNKEFDILKLRLNMYKDVVDYHIIIESKFTQTWKPKRLYFNERKEEFKEFAHKIIHIIIDHHPERLQGVVEDWNNEAYVREMIGKEGLLKVPNLKDEDMVFVTDVDELLDPDVIWYIKHYEGFALPIGVNIRWSFYGFYYRVHRPTIINVAGSVGWIKTQLHYNTHKLRGTQGQTMIGDGNNYAGWHCSWV